MSSTDTAPPLGVFGAHDYLLQKNLFQQYGFVFLVSACIIYSYPIYIWRVCYPMLVGRPDKEGNFAQGVAYIVIDTFLFLMLWWNYFNVLLRSPGYTMGSPQRANQEKTSLGFCETCQLPKPARTHHCRQCGRCVLKMDHHCPWVGQCVGHHNYKYFYHFLQWSSPYCTFVLITTIVAFASAGGIHKASKVMLIETILTKKSYWDVTQLILIIMHVKRGFFILLTFSAALFGLFTTSLVLNHTRLILTNVSTIESLAFSRGYRQARKNHTLEIAAQHMSKCDEWNEFPVWKREFDAMAKTDPRGRERWNLGSAGANWRYVLGDIWYMWFLPFGRSSGDGLSYPINPAVGEEMPQKYQPTVSLEIPQPIANV